MVASIEQLTHFLPQISYFVQLLSRVQLFATPWTAACQVSLSFTISWSLLWFRSVESLKLSNHLILCAFCSFWLQSLPTSGSFPKSQFFATGDQNIGASTSASVLPMNIWGWFSFQTDWFDFLDVQGTLKNLQHHNLKASILQCSSFFMVQLSHPYMTTGKIIALTIWTFVGKVMSLLFNTLSRFVIALLQSNKHLLILWLKSSFAMILESKKITSVIASTISPSIGHEVIGLDAMILVFFM